MKKINNSKLFIDMKKLNLNRKGAFLMTLVLLTLGIGNAWAGASTTMRTKSMNTANGLVYMTKGTNAAPALSAYKAQSDDVSQSTSSGGVADFIAWAKPVRGWEFQKWAGPDGNYTHNGNGGWSGQNSSGKTKLNTDHDHWDGVHDTIQGGNGGQASTNFTICAFFKEAQGYDITYAIPVGGSYDITYEYIIINSSTQLEEHTTDPYSMTPTTSAAKVETSYAADEVTLTTSSTNFVGWYEGATQKSTATSYKYPITKVATITALFKSAAIGTASGDLSPAVEALGTMTPGPSITIPVTAHGTWSASDFTVTFTEQTSPARGDITKGTVSYAQNSGNVLSSEGTLTIPFTYNPTSWGNTEVNVTVSPKDGATYGNTISFKIKASATQVLDYEACILLEGETEPQSSNTGTLAEMVTKANSMDSKFTLQLAKDVTISSPLSLRKSMKFDLNDKKITSTGTSAFSIDVAGIDVQIVDDGFGGLGEIATQSAQSGNVSVVTFTQKAKLTMQGGTLSAKNTGSGSAYGINVTQGSTFYMTNGLLTVTGVSEAQGVHVATASDYATLNGGSITVSAPTKAYGVWSAGQSNVTNATISAETTTGANAYGVYVNGNDGVSTLTTCTVTATAKTTGAYAAYVNAGRLNGNGGSFAAEAVTSGVYGVHVAAGATAMLQMNAVVTAEATGASGTSVFGVNNLGTVSLTNVSVTATSPTTAATAVNTATSATSTTIEGGTYRANTTGGTAYGLHHQYGTLNVDGGEFKAVGGGADILGARVIVNANIANATLWGEAQGDGGNTAYGFKGDVAGKAISLTNCTIKGISNNNKAYAIYSNTNVTATNCTLTATASKADEAYGVYAENGTNQLVNCVATVTANTVSAYGVKHINGTLTVTNGHYNVTANQTSADAAQDALLYGLHNASGKTTTVNGAVFDVNAANTAWSQNVYGAYINGTLISTNGEYSARGKNKVYGVYGAGSSTLTLSGNTIGSTITEGDTSYGIYAKENFTINGDIVNAVGNKTGIYALFFDASSSKGEVLDGKFSAAGNNTNGYGPINANGTVGNVKLKGGVAKTSANLKKYVVSGYDVYTLDNTHADYAAGYRYTIATENPSPYVCYIKNGNKYETLAAALQYTKDNSGTYTIIMTQSHTLPAGDYELPSNATLIIPRNTSHTTLNETVPKSELVGMIEEHLRLTLAKDAHLNVDGKIEVGGMLFSKESGDISYNNSPYARIYMESGSLIQLNNGARLYAWGFITGSGEIKAKSGSICYEMFRVGDMKAISPLGQYYLNNDAKFFPVQTYSVRNIEVPTTYYYNSQLITPMYEYNPGSLAHGWNGQEDIKLIGKSDAMFLVTTNDESSWVRKSYSGGKQVYEVNSSAKLGSLSIKVSSYTMDSRNYILPITATMKIHVLDGTMEVTQSTMFQPGTQVEIDKTATLKINSSFKDAYNSTQELRVYVIDQDQWLNTNNPDAEWYVHGKIEVAGKLYTTNKGTTTKSDGANIHSTNTDAGTVSFASAAASATTFKLVTGANNGLQTKDVPIESAKLKNGDNSYTVTAGTTSGEAWVYLNNTWQKTYTNGCFEVIGSTVYAKPSGYVALKKSQTDANSKLTGVEETNHTYLTADDKILILMDECQWWEVIATSDPAVFECTKEGYEGFYFYNTSTSKWELKTVNVTFYMKETGTDSKDKVVTTSYNGIPDQSVIATNPSKGTTAEFTYAFYGWKSSVTGDTIKWTDQLEVAKADMSYRPVFTETKRNYTITLVNANNGANVPLEVPYGEKPSYEPIKDADAQYTYSFKDWTSGSNHYATCADMPTVTGTATYTANWNNTVNEYNITWKNGNEILEVDENQPYGTITSFGGATPTKDADNNYVYAFSGWHNSLTNAPRANNETVTGAIIYTAQYNTTPRYAVTFNNYDGTQLDCIVYTQGETPAYGGVPARKRDDNGYFKFIGWKNSNGTDYAANEVLPAVSKKETYTAQYEYVTDFFTITLNNVDGNGATWSGKFGEGSTPFYNPNEDDVPVTPTKTSADPKYSYVFDGWSLTSGGAKLDPTPPVTEDATYWALFTLVENKYTVSFASNNDAWGIVSRDDVKEVPYGTAITTNGNTLTVNGKTITATPAAEDAQYMYRFERWESVPGTVTAETEIQAVFKAYVATVEAGGNTTYHTTIADAIETANGLTNNPTVTMCKNASTTSEIVITKTMTIELNGKKISSTQTTANTAVFKINASGKTVTIKDSGTNGEINHTASVSGYMYGLNLYAGSLNIESGTIYAKNNAANRAYGIYTESSASSITISGSAVVKAESSTSPFGLYSNVANSLTMNGGTFTASGSTSRGIYVKGTTNLTNATITVTGSSSYTIFAVSGNMTINSGSYTTSGGSGNLCIFHRNNAITINGGYFSTPNKLYKRDDGTYTGTITLKGGYYSNDTELAAKCADGYQVFALTDAEKAEVGNDYNYKVTTTYTVTFNAKGHGTAPESQVIEKGKKATEPEALEAEGYTFGGWYKEEGCTNAWDFNSDVVNANTTLFAKWTENTYDVTFNNGGHGTIKVAGVTVVDGATALVNHFTTKTLVAAASTGYTFAGWTTTGSVTLGSTSAASTNVKATAVSGTVTATWTPTNYSITYNNLEGASNSNPESYTIESANITLANPGERTGYDFEGWFTNEGLTIPAATPAIATGSTGAKEYWAKWTEANYSVTLHTNEGTINDGNVTTYTYGTGATLPTDVTRTGYDFGGWFDNSGLTGSAITTISTTATGAKEYWAKWTEASYAVTLHTNSGTINEGNITSYTYGTGATLPTNVTRSGHTFGGWFDNSGLTGSAVTTISTTATGAKEYWAKWTAVMDVLDVKTSMPIDYDATVTTTIVRVGGVLEVSASKKLTTGDLILEASEGASGEIAGDVQATNAYFHFTREGGFKARTWYAVAVPWKVYVAVGAMNNGVYTKKDDGDFVRQVLGTTYDLIYYDGKSRAEGKNKAWRYVEDDQLEHGGEHDNMRPGCAYMIYLTSDADTIRFKSSEAAPLHKSVDLSSWPSSIDGAYADWNGIANPATYHAYLYVYATHDKGQVYNADTKGYDLFDMDKHKLVVGQPIFIQTTSAGGSVDVNRNSYANPLSAPRRRAKEQVSQTQYELMLAASEADVTDRVIVCLDEDKEKDVYTVGHDLVKMGVSDIVPQMWINRYEKKMCINTVAGFDDTADYPLGIFAPKDGEYDLFIEDQPDNESMLYLTYDGAAIWNLSFGGYVANLNKGTNTHYGLRIVRKAPQITTGFDEAVVDAKGETHKVVINDQVYIIRGEKVYTIDGQMVK